MNISGVNVKFRFLSSFFQDGVLGFHVFRASGPLQGWREKGVPRVAVWGVLGLGVPGSFRRRRRKVFPPTGDAEGGRERPAWVRAASGPRGLPWADTPAAGVGAGVPWRKWDRDWVECAQLCVGL